MKTKAGSAVKKIAAFRMSSLYPSFNPLSTSYCLAPDAGIARASIGRYPVPEHAPILTPLATAARARPGTNLHSPPSNHLDLRPFLAPSRLVLGPLPSAVFGFQSRQ